MIILHGVDRFVAAVDLKVRQMDLATKLATAQALHLIERKTKLQLRKKTHRRGTPTPSAPGEPPALVTGNLRRGIQVDPVGGPEQVAPHRWRGQVGPTAVYGRIQELGGRAGRSTLPARPYLEPAYTESLPEIREIFRRAWIKATLS